MKLLKGIVFVISIIFYCVIIYLLLCRPKINVSGVCRSEDLDSVVCY